MIIIEQIKVEIERRIKELDEQIVDIYDSKAVLRKDELQKLLSFLSDLEKSLPAKVTDGEELEKEIERYFPESAFDTGWNYDDMQEVAHHFYELGCRRTAEKYDDIEYNRQRAEEQGSEGLEEEISKKYANDTTTMRTREQYAELAYHFYELGQQSKPKVRFPHEKDIVDKVFGAGNLDGWEYDEAKALVALAKEELLKDIKPKASEELDEEIERYLHSLGVGYGGWIDGMDDDDLRGIARHFAQWGSGTLKEVEL